MDCKVWVKAQGKFGKGAKCKEKVKQKKSVGKDENCKIYVKRQRSFGKEDFYENEVKRWEKSGKTELYEDGVKRRASAGQGRKITRGGQPATRANASSCGKPAPDRQHPKGSGKKRQKGKRQPQTEIGGRGMVEKRRPSGQSSDGIPRGKAQNTAPERRKGTFYLWLAAWWPTVAGRKRLARKGVRKRLQALEEPQLSARQ